MLQSVTAGLRCILHKESHPVLSLCAKLMCVGVCVLVGVCVESVCSRREVNCCMLDCWLFFFLLLVSFCRVTGRLPGWCPTWYGWYTQHQNKSNCTILDLRRRLVSYYFPICCKHSPTKRHCTMHYKVNSVY